MQRQDTRSHGPQGLDHSLEFEDVASHRRFHCGLYTMCLELAARRRWPSFTCRGCSLWGRQAPIPTPGPPATILMMPLAQQG